MTKELAYILGVYLGDGNVQIYHRKDGKGTNYVFRLGVIDEDFIKETVRCLELLGIKTYSVYNNTQKNNIILLHCRSKWLANYLTKETDWKRKIPQINGKDNKLAFLAGLLDSEGWVQINKKPNGMQGQIQIGICGTSDWIHDIAKMFQSVGVVIGKVKKRIPDGNGKIKSQKILYSYFLQVNSFINSGCYFTINRKRERLRDYNVISKKRQEKEKLFQDIKKYSKLSLRKAEKESGINRETIRLWRYKQKIKEPLYKQFG